MLHVNILFPQDAGIYEAFIAPILVNQHLLREFGVAVQVIPPGHPGRGQADLVIVASLVARNNQTQSGEAVTASIHDMLDSLHQQAGRVFWFDMSDSSGSNQFRYLPYVDKFLKAYVLADVSSYCTTMYRDRIYTDYYHREFGILEQKLPPERVLPSVDELWKIRVAWSSALGDFGACAPYVRRIHRYISLPFVYTAHFTPPDGHRSVALNARFSANHNRETISYQRQRLLEITRRHGIPSQRLSRREYLRELRQSRVALSPFGWGEVCFRDYEAILCGALLLKPDMTHMTTWPPLFVAGQTMAAFRWDLSDVEAVLDEYLAGDRWRDIAAQAQVVYRHYLFSRTGREAFCHSFKKIVED